MLKQRKQRGISKRTDDGCLDESVGHLAEYDAQGWETRSVNDGKDRPHEQQEHVHLVRVAILKNNEPRCENEVIVNRVARRI